MVYVVYVAVELERKQLKRAKDLAEWWRDPEDFANLGQKTASRLIGASIENSSVLKKTIQSSKVSTIRKPLSELGATGVKLHLLRSVNSVLIISMKFEDYQIPSGGLQRLSSIKIQRILSELGLENCLHTLTSTHAIMGSIAPDGDAWAPLTKDGWLHTHGSYIDSKVLEQTVTQVAVERSILNFGLEPRGWACKWLISPWVGRLLRKWPVEFLTDSESITINYHALRESLNLPKVRIEMLERSKHWWTVVSAMVALLGLIGALLSTWL